VHRISQHREGHCRRRKGDDRKPRLILSREHEAKTVHDFAYHRPKSLEQASRLAMEEGAMLLAGGQTLLRDMKLGLHSPASLIDIGGIIPSQIERAGDAISIGAGATHAEVAESRLLRQDLPILAALAGHIGDPAVRNRGTLGGALAANEPAGDYPAACLALDATVHTTKRNVAAGEFLAGDRRTLEPGEIVTAVTFRVMHQAAYIKLLNPAARYAIVGVFAAVAADGSFRVAVTGARSTGAFRWRDAENALNAALSPETVAAVNLPIDGLAEDPFADAPYRAHLTQVLARRAVALACGPAPGVRVVTHGSRSAA
jgi:aerobic carbon-monoxide dehydrogenase medium subunit